MKRNTAILLMGFCLILSMTFGCNILLPQSMRKLDEMSIKPNILIIYTDQQRFNTIQGLGNNEILTPNLNRLVNSGTAFTNAYVTSPVCVPSRWSLFSGMYTTTHETYSNHHVSTQRPETSLPIALKEKGYQTVLLGKNHSFLREGLDIDILDEGNHFEGKPLDGRSADFRMPWTVEEDPMHKLTNSAIKILNEGNQNKKPVFMWLSYLYPHTPYMCPEPYFSMYDSINITKPAIEPDGLKKAGKPYRQQFHKRNTDLLLPYDDEKTMRMKRNYYGMITMIDDEIGRIIKFLEDNNMRDNTLIIFTSDHGDYMGDHGLYTKSPALYDCLVRVPLIFNWPKVIEKQQIIDEPISVTDIMPTILDLVNVPIPKQVQGVSLTKELAGKKSNNVRKYVFSEYGIPGKPISEKLVEEKLPDLNTNPISYAKGIPWEANPVVLAGRIRMIRSKSYKLVEELNGTNEFYDMENDPNELVNLYGVKRYQKIQEEMLKELHHWKNKLPGIEKDTLPMGQIDFEGFINKRNKH